MKYKIVLEEVKAGKFGTVYSFKMPGETEVEFYKAIEILQNYNLSTCGDLISSINIMVTKRGFQDEYFDFNEGKKDDKVCRFEVGESNFRLYCIRLDEVTIVCGNGDIKTTRTYNEDDTLNFYVSFLQKLYKNIEFRLLAGSLEKTALGLIGNLEFEIEFEDL